MAAAAWRVYNGAKQHLLNGTIDLDATNVLKMYLYKSTSSASTPALSTLAALTTGFRVAGGGFKGAKFMTGSVKAGADASQKKWSAAARVFTASGAAIGSVMYAVLAQSGGKLVAWSKLSTAAFNVTTGNTLTVTMNALGIFTIR